MKSIQPFNAHRRRMLKAAAGLGSIGLLGVVTPAYAAASKIFVSGSGNDSNSGSLTSPMRSFQGALGAVAAGGEIVVLDTAGYGTLNITQDVSITVPPGVNAFVTVSSGFGVLINSGLNVTLRGLIVEAATTGLSAGISADQVSSLVLQSCKIIGFGTGGSETTTGGLVISTNMVLGSVMISDTIISNCPGCGISHGITGAPTNSILVAERCQLLSNGIGLLAASSGRVTLRDSVISNNTDYGVRAGGFGVGDVKVTVENCAVTDNGIGIFSFNSTNATVSNTAITGNTTGVSGGNSHPQTYGNNQLINNTTNGTWGPTVSPS